MNQREQDSKEIDEILTTEDELHTKVKKLKPKSKERVALDWTLRNTRERKKDKLQEYRSEHRDPPIRP